ncbi:MAG TPA: radical SAM protein [Bryobacteraceae bacterium]|nr:radical SAM protein [Bryobacteraceae bacterium]
MEFSDEGQHGRGSGTLVLHLLGQCNLHCAHCYMDGAPERREQLPLSAVLDAISECDSLDIGALYITGGEPLLYPGFDFVVHAAKLVPGLETTVCTNGMRITQRHVDLFLDARVRVNISVDGPPDFHDEFRRLRGAFAATEKRAHLLAEAGVPVTIVMTVSQGNVDSVHAMADWAYGIGAVQFRVQPLLKLGRAGEIAEQRLTSEQLNRLLIELSDLANTYAAHGLKCSLVGVTRRFLLTHPCGAYVCNGAGCHRRVQQEIKKVVIREDGVILPEVTNLDHRYAIGDIRDGSLRRMIHRFFADGYAEFDQLCRAAYNEVIPTYPEVVVPWDQILAERSRTWHPGEFVHLAAAGCGTGCGA